MKRLLSILSLLCLLTLNVSARTEALLPDGVTFNTLLKRMVNQVASTTTWDTMVEYIEFRTESSETGTLISAEGSAHAAYITYDKRNKKLVFHTRATDFAAPADFSKAFYRMKGVVEIAGFEHVDMQRTTDMSEMFSGCSELQSVDMAHTNAAKVSNMRAMFDDCANIKALDFGNINTQKVTDMSFLFRGCLSLYSLDISSFNTSEVTDMQSMFESCGSMGILILRNFNTSKVTDMRRMFYHCGALNTLDLTSFNTSQVTNMKSMFETCNSLAKLDLRNFNTAKVTDMSFMFSECRKLATLDISKFNTNNVEDMSSMFYFCSVLKLLDLSHFYTAKVRNMNAMFSSCTSLTNINMSHFDTSNVTDMGYMFYCCSKVKQIDMSNFDTSNVTNMHGMFYACTALTSLSMSHFNTRKVTDMAWMLYSCYELEFIKTGVDFDMSKVADKTGMFTSTADNTRNCKITCTNATKTAMSSRTSMNTRYFTWDIIKVEKYTLKYMYDPYKEIVSADYEAGQDVTLQTPADPVREGYVFKGWNAELPTVMPAHDVTISAVWEWVPVIVNLTDDEDYTAKIDMECDEITYTRTFTHTDWQAIYLPFGMSYYDWKDDLEVYELTEFLESATRNHFHTNVKQMRTYAEPNKPYLVKPKRKGTIQIKVKNATLKAAAEKKVEHYVGEVVFTECGTYKTLSGEFMYDEGSARYWALSGGKFIYPTTTGQSLKPFRWYLSVTDIYGRYAKHLLSFGFDDDDFNDGTLTIITADGMSQDKELVGVYSLSGTYLGKNLSGITQSGVYVCRYSDGTTRKINK